MARNSNGLTPKQQKVYDLLAKGLKPPAVARRMKISPNGVYGHMRRIQEAGLELPAIERTRRSPAQVPDDPPVTSANGSSGKAETVVQIEQLVRDAIGQADGRVEQIDREVAGLEDERGTIDQRLADLAAERRQIDDRRTRLAEVTA